MSAFARAASSVSATPPRRGKGSAIASVAAGCRARIKIGKAGQATGALDLDRLKREMAAPVIVDLRNVFRPAGMAEHGVAYESVGRPGKPRRSSLTWPG